MDEQTHTPSEPGRQETASEFVARFDTIPGDEGRRLIWLARIGALVVDASPDTIESCAEASTNEVAVTKDDFARVSAVLETLRQMPRFLDLETSSQLRQTAHAIARRALEIKKKDGEA